jgi:hypothetical protein
LLSGLIHLVIVLIVLAIVYYVLVWILGLPGARDGRETGGNPFVL